MIRHIFMTVMAQGKLEVIGLGVRLLNTVSGDEGRFVPILEAMG